MPEEESSKGGSKSGSSLGIERLYQIYEKLNSAEDKTKLESEYRLFLDAAHNSDKEKRLASQFITRFVEFFPNCTSDATSAMIDLCEEEDPAIRKQVQKDLVTVCKKVNGSIPIISSILSQLLLTADSIEFSTLQSSLLTLFNIHPIGALGGVFSEIGESESGVVRESSVRFLASKIKELGPETGSIQFQKLLLSHIQSVIHKLDEEEFVIFMDLLLGSRLSKIEKGQELLIKLIVSYLDSIKLEAFNLETVAQIWIPSDYAIEILSHRSVSPNAVIEFYVDKILPKLDELAEAENGVLAQYGLLKRFSELISYFKNNDKKLKDHGLFNKVFEWTYAFALKVLPTLPDPSLVEGVERMTDAETVILDNINFSFVEVALFILHTLLSSDLLPPKGQHGLKGQLGPKGQDGPKDDGPKGHDGPKEEDGPKDQDVPKGQDGPDGPKEEDGTKGQDGHKEEDGSKGQDGAKGQDGHKEEDGSKGQDGAKGQDDLKGQYGSKGQERRRLVEECRGRLALLGRGAKSFERQLRTDLGSSEGRKRKHEGEREERGPKEIVLQKMTSLKVLRNVGVLSREVLEESVSKSGSRLKIQLSWFRPKAHSFKSGSGREKGERDESESGRRDREIQRYQPPGGKYSGGGQPQQKYYKPSGGGQFRSGGGSGGRNSNNRMRGNYRGNNSRRY